MPLEVSVKLKIIAPLLFLLVSVLVLQGLVGPVIPPFILPSPQMMLDVFLAEFSTFLSATLSTLQSTAKGFALSICGGLSLAFLFSWSPLIRQAVYPYMVFFQTVPIVAIAPLLVIWFGFGPPTVVASAQIVSIFPILASAMTGLELATRENRELFRVLKSTSSQTLKSLAIPSAIPSVFSGLRVAAGLSVVGAIVGEFIAGGGLGSLIDSARTQQRTDMVFVAVLLSAIIGFLLVTLVDTCRYVVLRYRPYLD